MEWLPAVASACAVGQFFISYIIWSPQWPQWAGSLDALLIMTLAVLSICSGLGWLAIGMRYGAACALIIRIISIALALAILAGWPLAWPSWLNITVALALNVAVPAVSGMLLERRLQSSNMLNAQ